MNLYKEASELCELHTVGIVPEPLRSLMAEIVSAADSRDGGRLGQAVSAVLRCERIQGLHIEHDLNVWVVEWNQMVRKGKAA
jgi:hypothetical protein